MLYLFVDPNYFLDERTQVEDNKQVELMQIINKVEHITLPNYSIGYPFSNQVIITIKNVFLILKILYRNLDQIF